MKSDDVFLTADGAKKMRGELGHLINIERVKISERLRKAIEQGDLSENADYIKAKEDQAFLEGKIQEMEHSLKNVVIIDKRIRKGDIIEIGSIVTLQEENYKPETYHLVGPKEADPKNGKISYKSPIGNAILEHKEGDKVTINTPAGDIYLKIISIK